MLLCQLRDCRLEMAEGARTVPQEMQQLTRQLDDFRLEKAGMEVQHAKLLAKPVEESCVERSFDPVSLEEQRQQKADLGASREQQTVELQRCLVEQQTEQRAVLKDRELRIAELQKIVEDLSFIGGQELAKAARDAESWLAENEELQQQLADLQSKSQERLSEKDGQISRLNDELKELRVRNEEGVAEVARLSNELHDCRLKNAAYLAEVSRLSGELKDRWIEEEEGSVEVSRLTNELKTKDQLIEALRLEMERSISEAKSETDELRQMLHDQEAMENERKAQLQSQALQIKMHEREAFAVTMAHKEREIADMNRNISKLEAELATKGRTAAADALQAETSAVQQVPTYVCTHVYAHVYAHVYTHLYTHFHARGYTCVHTLCTWRTHVYTHV